MQWCGASKDFYDNTNDDDEYEHNVDNSDHKNCENNNYLLLL